MERGIHKNCVDGADKRRGRDSGAFSDDEKQAARMWSMVLSPALSACLI